MKEGHLRTVVKGMVAINQDKHKPNTVINTSHLHGSSQGDQCYPERKCKPRKRLAVCALHYCCFKKWGTRYEIYKCVEYAHK